jgi:hypothetical protein
MNEPMKAAKVFPPEPEIVEVNMTKLYGTVTTLVVASAGLTAANIALWRRTKKNREYVEALGDYVSKLVTETRCGNLAYQAILDGAGDVSQAEVDWSRSGSFDEDDPEFHDLVEAAGRKIRLDHEV